MVSMQDQDTVQRAYQHIIHFVIRCRGRKHHSHEVCAEREVITRIDKRLTDRVLVRHRHQRRHLGD